MSQTETEIIEQPVAPPGDAPTAPEPMPVKMPVTTPASAPLKTARAILVLGMHRSGTSALARVLNLLGVELGDDLLPAAADNETGFWEHRQIQFIHDRIYETLKRDWTHVSPLAANWWECEEIASYRQQLREVLQRDFGNQPIWGVKDPRLCAMLPLWRPLLAEMNVEPACVLICRNPAEVVQSLAKRDGFTSARVYLLWLRSIVDAERGSRGLPRAIATFECLLQDWSQQVDRIGRALGVDWPRAPEDVTTAVAEFIRPANRHHQVDDRAFLDKPDAPELVRRLHGAVLQAGESDDLSELSAAVDFVAEQLEHGQPLLSEFIANLEQEHRGTVIEKNLESIRLNSQFAQAVHATNEANAAAAHATQATALAVKDAAEKAAIISAQGQEIAGHIQQHQIAAMQLAELGSQSASLQAQLAEATHRLGSEIASAQQNAASLQATINHGIAQLESERARTVFFQNESGQYQIQRMILQRVMARMQALPAWRWSAPLRNWRRRPLTESDLLPVADMRKIGPNRWECSGPAELLLPCLPIQGQLRIELKMDVSVRGHARLYFDTGRLFNAGQVVDLGPVENAVTVTRELTLNEAVHCFRLDPLDRSGEFVIHQLRIFCVSN